MENRDCSLSEHRNLLAAILLSFRGTPNLFMFELIEKIFSEEERKERG